MKKIFLIGLFTFLNGIPEVHAHSGGWVGNAPIASYTPQIAFQSYYSSEGETEEWNSILLPKGQSRINLGYRYCDTCYTKSYPTFGFNHGFTSKLTMLDLATLGYSLKSGNGIGDEWALILGITDGVVFSSSMGTSVGFGVGIAYAYSESDWRVDASTILSGYYNTNHSFWKNYKSLTTVSYTKWLNENWGVGFSTSYLYRTEYLKTLSCGENCNSTEEIYRYNDFTDPKIYALWRLNKTHEFQLSYQQSLANDRSIITLGYSYNW